MDRMIGAIHLMKRNEQSPHTRDGPRMRRKDRSMTDTPGKVAVVTGASGGIGRAVALRLARDGFRVVLNYAGNAENAEAAVAEIKDADGHAVAVQEDVADAAGVEGLFPVLANELRGREITVNAVAPGPVSTELFLKGKTEAQIEQFRRLAPLERLGRPEDIADVISFLAGPAGGWVNAQVLRANGGYA